MRDSKKKPEKLRAVKEQEKRAVEQREAIKTAVAGLQRGGQVISSAEVVQSSVQDNADLEVSN